MDPIIATTVENTMFQRLIYISRSLIGTDAEAVEGILATSQRRNKESGVTGMLWAASDGFAQVLEGPAANVFSTFERIRADSRHTDIEVLFSEAVSWPQFGSWSMHRGEDTAECDGGTVFIVGFALSRSDARMRRLHQIVTAALDGSA